MLAALPGAASAHDGIARLILEPDRVNPGGVVVDPRRGPRRRRRDAASRSIGSSGRTELTTVTSDGQGHFTVAIEVSPRRAAGRLRDRGDRRQATPDGAPVRRGGSRLERGWGAARPGRRPPGRDPVVRRRRVARAHRIRAAASPPGAIRPWISCRSSPCSGPWPHSACSCGALGGRPARRGRRACPSIGVVTPELQATLKRLPDRPGVYLMKDAARRRAVRRQGAEPAQPRPLVLAEAGAAARPR